MNQSQKVITSITLVFIIAVFLGAIIYRKSLIEIVFKQQKLRQNLALTNKLISIEPEAIDSAPVAVTYALDTHGRFGDQLVNYLKALWVSWKYDVPLVYRPFYYSDQLKMSDVHSIRLNEQTVNLFSNKIEVSTNNKKTLVLLDKLSFENKVNKAAEDIHSIPSVSVKEPLQLKRWFDTQSIPLNFQNGILCVVSFYTSFPEEYDDQIWDNEEFRSLLAKLISPKKEIPLLKIPEDRISVALHVRTGGGFDPKIEHFRRPGGFPSDQFYLNSLKEIARIFPGKSLYVHLFTDDENPTSIRQKYMDKLKNWGIENHIVMDCRVANNRYDLNVLDDFFHMTQFDCLIRPRSSFSRCVSAVSGPLIEIMPTSLSEIRKGKDGDLIFDSLVSIRASKGGVINRRYIVNLE